ncbi:MAG: DUF1801 domain-containing protein [Microbacterium sp.]|uniref:iron chaperone n=2 Tax=Microbacterium sp. TaxID=51671 RepID=UPI001AC716CF|nr:DUF1801 domain-containing protein [Microbacterium sp.]MBN9153452.1 DUF1801 domain-containing protein [Microbacterium sp.]MBN9171163.1 DUF1801 domain-containing protein [Microbacterium sp.]
MGTIDDYVADLDPADRAAIERVYRIAAETVGADETAQGTSYGMPALLYRGTALVSVMRAKKHIGVYPFSGRVPEAVGSLLDGYDHEKGTIRFQPEHPLTDEAIAAIADARRAEIDDPSVRRRARG